MKTILKCIIALTIMFVLGYGSVFAQLTGNKSIPGTYPSIAAAIDDLNTNGVGTGGVTFLIQTGYTETIPMGGLVIDIQINPPTAANEVVFQKNFAGTNPVLQTDTNGSGVRSTLGIGFNCDAILKVVGTDYVTFSNIDFVENYTGTSQVLQTECGILMLRKSSTDGCKNVRIIECTFQQQQIDRFSMCIATYNRNLAGGVTNPTTTGGRHENISIQGCTLNNSSYGFVGFGYNAPSPYDLYDHFLDIGGTTGNTFSNIGSGLAGAGTNGHQGILVYYHDSLTISNNTIRISSGLNDASVYAINLTAGSNSSATIHNNDISDSLRGHGNSDSPIICSIGNGIDNTINITNNTIHDCRFDSMATSQVNYINIQSSPYTLNITGNTIRDNQVSDDVTTPSNTITGISISSSNPLFGSSTTIADNTIKNISRNTTSLSNGDMYGIRINGPNYNTEISNNEIDSLHNPTPEGEMIGIRCRNEADGKLSIYGNTISNLYKESDSVDVLSGINYIGDTDTIEIYDNNIFNIRNGSGYCIVSGIYSRGSQTDGYENVYDNTIHNITNKGAEPVIGMYLQCETTSNTAIKNVTGNVIYDIVNNLEGQTGGMFVEGASVVNVSGNRLYGIINKEGTTEDYYLAYGMFLGRENVSTNYNVYNNMISEVYAPKEGNGYSVTGLIVEGGDTANLYYNTIYMDGSSIDTVSLRVNVFLQSNINATLKNNILVNKATTGYSAGIFKETNVIYNSSSNNNNLYVTGAGVSVYYFDGSAPQLTFADFQTAVAPGDSNSFTEDSPFMNVTTNPYDLDMQEGVATLCDGGAMPVAGITTDIHGTTRNPTMPDVGADEFNVIVTNVQNTSTPAVYKLYQNYPNPFNPTTKIKFDIPKASFVSLKVYDITGREIATLVNNTLEARTYELEWNGGQFASGVYFFRIEAGEFTEVKRMMLVK